MKFVLYCTALLKITKEVSSSLGTLAGGVGLGFETVDLINGDISAERFSYHIAGFGAAEWATYATGNPVVGVGLAVYDAVYLYDSVSKLPEAIWR